MKRNIKRALFVMVAIILVFTMNVYATDTVFINDSSKQFNVTVETLRGEAISNANVYVYSFIDDNIVASGMTNTAGKCNLLYLPELSKGERGSAYRDYLIYVQKSGYISSTWDLTKFYDFDDSNETEFLIQLAPDNQLSAQSKPTMANDEILQYISSQPEKPFYVFKDDEFPQVAPCSANAQTSVWNVEVPIGCFHICKGAILTVEFKSSDKVVVQSGTLNDFGSFSINFLGSRSRKFSSTTTFPSYSTSTNTAKKKMYYTSGTLEKYYTVDGPSGRLNTHYVLDSLVGGTIFGDETSCYSCNASYDKAATDYGTYLPVLEGGKVSLMDSTGRTLDFGLSIPLSDVGLNYSLGVKVETSKDTILTYVPKSNYNIALYDIDRTKKVWHVTNESAN